MKQQLEKPNPRQPYTYRRLEWKRGSRWGIQISGFPGGSRLIQLVGIGRKPENGKRQ